MLLGVKMGFFQKFMRNLLGPNDQLALTNFG